MIGIPALSWVPDESKLDNLTAVVAELEHENGPVTEAEKRDVRAEWLDGLREYIGRLDCLPGYAGRTEDGYPVLNYDRTAPEQTP